MRLPLLPSPSRFALATACAFPWSPRSPRWPRQVPNAAMAFGTALHSAAESLAAGAELPAPPADVAELSRLAECIESVAYQLERDRAAGWSLIPEVAMAYDVSRSTARPLARASHRDYSDVRAGELTGTADLILRRGGSLTVRDWKTGHAQATWIDVETDPQLRAYALFAARLYGCDAVRVEVAHVSESGVRVVGCDLDAFDLDSIAADLVQLVARVTGESVPQPGRHCSECYCPIVASCPATVAALAAVDAAAALPHPLSTEIRDAEHAASVRVRSKAARAALDAIDDALRAWVTDHGPVEVAPGVLYGAVLRDGRERVDLEVAGAVDALRAVLGEHAAGAIELSTSKAAIERAARAAAGGERGKLASVRRAALERLRECGALKQGAPYTVVEEFRAEAGAENGKEGNRE